MMRWIIPAKLGFALVLAVTFWGGGAPVALAESEADTLKRELRMQNKRLRAVEARKPSDFASIMVNPGQSKKDADDYYVAIAPLINFKALCDQVDKDNPCKSNFSDLLAYLGFKGLDPADLELLDSDLLMPQTKAAFDKLASEVKDKAAFTANLALGDFAKDRVLVSRFFAPKIVNFDAPANTDPKQNPHKAGWRKLVRLVPTAKSDAAKGNIREVYILFNHFQADVNNYPFLQRKTDGTIKPDTESVNNQVILVPKTHKAGVEDSMYWMVYQPNSTNYQLGFALNAAFDVIAPGTGKTQDYFRSNGLRTVSRSRRDQRLRFRGVSSVSLRENQLSRHRSMVRHGGFRLSRH